MPWAAAIALGAIVAPPDAAAATAILRQVKLPHRLLKILEGESLLNDASALLIYRVAVGVAAVEHFRWSAFAPAIILALAGSLIAGFLFAKLSMKLTRRITDAPSAIIVQFRRHLYGVDRCRAYRPVRHPDHRRLCHHHRAHRTGADAGALEVPSYAVWRRPCSCSTCCLCDDRHAAAADLGATG